MRYLASGFLLFLSYFAFFLWMNAVNGGHPFLAAIPGVISILFAAWALRLVTLR